MNVYPTKGLRVSVRTEYKGPPRGFGDLGKIAIYFQGAGEHW